jgi:hypothetical protein
MYVEYRILFLICLIAVHLPTYSPSVLKKAKSPLRVLFPAACCVFGDTTLFDTPWLATGRLIKVQYII